MADLSDESIDKLAKAITQASQKGNKPSSNEGGDKDWLKSVKDTGKEFGVLNGILAAHQAGMGNSNVAIAAMVTRLDKHGAALLAGETSLRAHSDIVTKNMKEGFAKNLPLMQTLGVTVEALSGYMISSYDTYKSLAASGASFNGDLIDMRIAAANSRLSLDEFADVVSSNTSGLSALGAGVSGGAKVFANMSKAFFDSGVSQELFAMGINAKEQNELLLEQMTINRRRNRGEGLSQAELIRSTQKYVAELDTISKLTGKSRKELQDANKDKMRDGATQAKLRLLERQGVEGAAETYQTMQTSISKLGPGFQNLLQDYIQMGVPLTDATKKLAATSPEAARLLAEAAQQMKAGNQDAAVELTKQAEAAALKSMNSTQGLTVASMGALGGVAEVAANTLQANQDLLDQVKKQGQIVDGVNDNLGSFSAALEKTITQLESERAAQVNNEIVGALASTEQTLKDTAAAATEGVLTEAKSSLESVGKTVRDSMTDVGREEIEKVTNSVAAMIPGVSGAKQTITDLQGILDNNKNLSDAQRTQIQELISNLAMLNGAVLTATTQAEKEKAEAALSDVLKKVDDFRSTSDIDDSGDSITTQISETLQGIWSGIKGFFSGGDEEPEMMAGTLGAFGTMFKDFGKETTAKLHGMEAVIPKNSPQGDLLSAFPGGLNQAVAKMKSSMPAVTAQAQTAMASMPVPSTSSGGNAEMVKSLNEKLDTLNQNVLQLVEINNRTADSAQRQVRSLKNVGTTV